MSTIYPLQREVNIAIWNNGLYFKTFINVLFLSLFLLLLLSVYISQLSFYLTSKKKESKRNAVEHDSAPVRKLYRDLLWVKIYLEDANSSEFYWVNSCSVCSFYVFMLFLTFVVYLGCIWRFSQPQVPSKYNVYFKKLFWSICSTWRHHCCTPLPP